jgi:hypothetical protein
MARPSAQLTGGGSVRSPFEAISWRSANLLFADPLEPGRRRLRLLQDYARLIPHRADEITALISAWMRDRQRPLKERRHALDALLAQIDPDEVRALALDASLPVRLRGVAALAYGVEWGERAEAYEMLTGLSRAPGTTVPERLGCLAWRAVLPVLLRLERGGRQVAPDGPA